jgi:hypothetical protein
MIRPTPLALAFGAVLASATIAAAQGPVLVTVTGAIENTNRGPMDPERDKLFEFLGIEFQAAHEWDHAALRALPQMAVEADFPMGGDRVTFIGPAFADLLEAVGAQGETVWAQALDGYAVEVPVTELTAREAILALEIDGEALGIGGKGPAMVAFPRAARADLAEMNDDWWIWQVFHVRVE